MPHPEARVHKPAARGPLTRFVLHLPADLGNRLLNACDHFDLGTGKLLAKAVESLVERLEAEHGGQFPQRPTRAQLIAEAGPTVPKGEHKRPGLQAKPAAGLVPVVPVYSPICLQRARW